MKSGKPISKNGRVVERLKSENELNFFSKQMRISLRNCGRIDPENIDEYIAYGGYEALGKVLTEMEPEDVIKTIKDSGLRGRGGGGFPAGVKWQFAAEQQVKEKYVCCNADEGDPVPLWTDLYWKAIPMLSSKLWQSQVMPSDLTRGFVYVRAEYPIAVQRLTIAIEQAREYGLLG